MNQISESIVDKIICYNNRPRGVNEHEWYAK